MRKTFSFELHRHVYSTYVRPRDPVNANHATPIPAPARNEESVKFFNLVTIVTVPWIIDYNYWRLLYRIA